MATEVRSGLAFVIKPEEIAALNYLSSNHPRPQTVEWINRSMDRKLRQSSVDMLLRTLHRDISSPSVVKLHRDSGLRVVFTSERDRNAFSRLFAEAKREFQRARSRCWRGRISSSNRPENGLAATASSALPPRRPAEASPVWRLVCRLS